MGEFGKIFVVLGAVLVVVGGLLWFGGRVGLGRLPGDIYVNKGNFTFAFPIVTCIIVSIILTLIFRLFSR